MAFGLVHSSVERSTSRHGRSQACAWLLYQLAFVLFGFRIYCMVLYIQYIPWTPTKNVVLVLEILLVAYPIFGILKDTWKPKNFRGFTQL